MTDEKLTQLGFGDVYSETIARTAQRMRETIDTDPEIAEAVFSEIRADNPQTPVNDDNADLLLSNWVQENAEALHRDRAKAFLAPFKAIINLFEEKR